LHKNVHSNFIGKSQKLETAHCPSVVHLSERLNCGIFLQWNTTRQWKRNKELKHIDESQNMLSENLHKNTFIWSSRIGQPIYGKNKILTGKRDGRGAGLDWVKKFSDVMEMFHSWLEVCVTQLYIKTHHMVGTLNICSL